MHNPTTIDSSSSNPHNMPDNEAISKAIDDLSSQEVPNVNATAKKYNIIQSMLQCCFTAKTTSRHEGCSRSFMLLTDAQELTLIEYLNKLSVCSLHMTPQLLENFVVEIIHRPVGQ